MAEYHFFMTWDLEAPIQTVWEAISSGRAARRWPLGTEGNGWFHARHLRLAGNFLASAVSQNHPGVHDFAGISLKCYNKSL